MSKVFFFMRDIKPLETKTFLPDVYCPVGGYDDKNLGRRFDSKGDKVRFLRAHKMREAELYNPEKSLGGTEGCSVKRRGPRGNFRSHSMPTWMRQQLERTAHVG